MNELTSIILNCYDHTQMQRNSSMAAAVAITRYTDPKDYEFIVVDCEPMKDYIFNYKPPILVGNTNVKVDKFIELNPDPGYYAAMNIGAENAKGEYLCFIENDVFVTPNWLPNLRWYLENNVLDAVFPHQAEESYDNYIENTNKTMEDAYNTGCEEQGLMLIKRSSFDKLGGWDKKLPVGFGWKNMLENMNDNHVKFGTTMKSVITHLCGLTFFTMSLMDNKRFENNLHIENTYISNKTK